MANCVWKLRLNNARLKSGSPSVVAEVYFKCLGITYMHFEPVFVNVNVRLPGSQCLYEKAVDYIVALCCFFDLSTSHEILMQSSLVYAAVIQV